MSTNYVTTEVFETSVRSFTHWSKVLGQPRSLGFVSISRPKCHKVANLLNASILFSGFSEVSADPIRSSTASQELYKVWCRSCSSSTQRILNL